MFAWMQIEISVLRPVSNLVECWCARDPKSVLQRRRKVSSLFNRYPVAGNTVGILEGCVGIRNAPEHRA